MKEQGAKTACIKEDQIESQMRKYHHIIEDVVSKFYIKYEDYVEECDLYSQAYLTFLNLYKHGWIRPRSRDKSQLLIDRISDNLMKYCETEYQHVCGRVRLKENDVIDNNFHDNLDVHVCMQAALKKLTQKQQTMIDMYYNLGYTMSEIASIFGMTGYTVKIQLVQACNLLRYMSNLQSLDF